MHCTDVAKVANLEGPEELVAEDSPITEGQYYLPHLQEGR
jgi:hypothetical protein